MKYWDDNVLINNTLSLEEPLSEWVFSESPYDPVEFSNEMNIFREMKKGLGLAANQVGIPYRVISVKGFDSCLFNPKIVFESPEKEVMEEGCLSFPGLIVKVKRAKVIRIRAADAFGNVTTKMYKDMTARILQHEIDHINGIVFYKRANKFHRDQAFRQKARRAA